MIQAVARAQGKQYVIAISVFHPEHFSVFLYYFEVREKFLRTLTITEPPV